MTKDSALRGGDAPIEFVHDIAVLPGDGIGPEVMAAAWTVLEAAAASVGGFELRKTEYPWGCDQAAITDVIMPEDGPDRLRAHDAIFLTSVGNPKVENRRIAWELYFLLQKRLGQDLCVRPIRSFPGVPTLLARNDGPIDLVIVREFSEGEYSGAGGMLHVGDANGVAIESMVVTRQSTERVARHAFELARGRRNLVTNVTKSNVLRHAMGYWDAVVAEIALEYPDVEYEKIYIDTAQMWMVQRPDHFDVLLSTNLYGDILSDLAGAVAGSIGLSESANVSSAPESPSLFQPVHGSAPDIAGQGIANPVATILAGASMLEHLGERPAAMTIRRVVKEGLEAGVRTPDIGGTQTTVQVAEDLVARLAGAHE